MRGYYHPVVLILPAFTVIICVVMHLSMLSPRGGPRAYVGHLTSVAFPTLENLTKKLGPRVGTFAFFAWMNRTKSHHSMCLSVFRAAIKALKDGCFQWR